jgi:hypothetical protein
VVLSINRDRERQLRMIPGSSPGSLWVVQNHEQLPGQLGGPFYWTKNFFYLFVLSQVLLYNTGWPRTSCLYFYPECWNYRHAPPGSAQAKDILMHLSFNLWIFIK